MKQTMLALTAAAAVLIGSPAAFTAPFEPKDVAANPALLVHLDVDALKTSSVGQSILSDPDVKDKLSAVAALFDFDLRKQLHGLTVYTTEDHPKDGALIVYADFDPNRLLTLAKVADDFHGLTNGSRVIYTWVDDKKKSKEGGDPHMFGAIAGHRVILGQEQAHLESALDVLEGKAPSYAGKKGLPKAADGESVIAEGVLLKFDFDGGDPNAAIFKMSKSVRLKLSEKSQKMTAALRFEAANADTATNIASIAQGLLGLIKMQNSDSNAMKLANAITLKQDGAAVGVTLSLPSSDLTAMIQDGEKKGEEHTESTNAPAEKK